MRMLFFLMLTALISCPALAQTRHQPDRGYRTAPRYQPHVVRVPRVARNPNDVVFSGHVIGRDPDPWIRLEILRHAESGWPD